MVLDMLEAKGVDKYFGDFQVLDDISFNLSNGVAAVLIGRNGAGKSTLIRCIAGLLRYEGSITIDGFEVMDHP
ncbi:MAG TPA: ATP-binding cassette domain-containing protein, partial [Thermoprotei archaeon]|nr:ATP-binding cassette domain-containing protein [Thermoprotei archaeon]